MSCRYAPRHTVPYLNASKHVVPFMPLEMRHLTHFSIWYILYSSQCGVPKIAVYFVRFKYGIPHTWISLDKGESLACQITSPFNNKLGCFYKNNQYFCLIGKLSGKPVTLLCLKSSMHYR